MKSMLITIINSIYKCWLRFIGIKLGKHVFINGRLILSGTKHIIISDEVYINSKIKANPIGGNLHCMFKTIGHGSIYIGRKCRISNVSICSESLVKIEDNVYIGGDVRIYDTDFHSKNYNIRISENDNDVCSKPIFINSGAFIGASTIILKGVSIGEHSIIGAGSVVTKNVPNGQIWGGNPAKFIKNINDSSLL